MIDAKSLLASALTGGNVPPSLRPPEMALWHAKAGNWDRAHDLCQEIPDPDGAWIHAYLHREEGDLGNAQYWYHRARRNAPRAGLSLADEWLQLAEYFCEKQ